MTMAEKIDIHEEFESSDLFFEAFGLCFRFLSRIYLEIPSRKFIDEIFKNNLFFEWPIAENQKTVSRGLEILQDYSSQWKPVLMESLKQDYTRLFIGLEKILAPPYASVYLSEEHLLYEKPVLDVRRFYEKIGLSVNPIKRQPDDHIGFELYCLSFLCENAAQSAKKKEILKIDGYLTALSEFLSDHLNPWLNLFLSKVWDNAQTSYFLGTAFLTLGLVESLTSYLDKNENR